MVYLEPHARRESRSEEEAEKGEDAWDQRRINRQVPGSLRGRLQQLLSLEETIFGGVLQEAGFGSLIFQQRPWQTACRPSLSRSLGHVSTVILPVTHIGGTKIKDSHVIFLSDNYIQCSSRNSSKLNWKNGP